jgi:hypothetical protein
MNRLRAFFSSVPYQLNDKTERYYQTVCYLVFRLLGQFAQVEVASARGRADMVIGTARQLYVFEFKLSGAGSADEALKQIDDRGYLLPYTAGNRELVKIGAVFDKKTRILGDWKHAP